MKVLVVDDNATDRAVIKHVFEKEGFDIDEAGDGMEAVRLFKMVHYDVVTLDWIMPGQDGFNTLLQMRQIEQAGDRPRTHVCIVSTKDMDKLVVKAMVAGANGYIEKPIQKKDVVSIVREICMGRR